MNKKVLSIVIIIVGTVTLAGCSAKTSAIDSAESKNNLKIEEERPKADKVEVFLFHATQRCATCIAIGRLSGDTVYEYFQPELRDGKIEFREVNIDLPENKALAEKFQAGGSSLKINAIYDGQDHISEDARVWRLTQDEAQFKSYLKYRIDNFLGK